MENKINKDYFNIEDYINNYNMQFKSKPKILIVNFARNIGKSFSI